jgi:hypothetical protein
MPNEREVSIIYTGQEFKLVPIRGFLTPRQPLRVLTLKEALVLLIALLKLDHAYSVRVIKLKEDKTHGV